MRLAMAQMNMTDSVPGNLRTTLNMMERAKADGADLIFFPEIQLSPFFPKYPGRDAARWRMRPDGPEVREIQDACRSLSIWASPNLYLEMDGGSYDTSLLIDDRGEIRGISKMVHIYQAENFYEADYYTPSDTGFQVYDTPFGKIGIVICFDRHIPSSIRACAAKGADLIIIPTANLITEPMELFEWEIRVQAFQNTVFAAMCNRTGPEDNFVFSGESLAANPDGTLLFKADSREGLFCVDILMEQAKRERAERRWLSLDVPTA